MDKPSFVSEDFLQEILEYLDSLRESGEINMYGARPYVENVFHLMSIEASAIVKYWMATFSERHPRVKQ